MNRSIKIMALKFLSASGSARPPMPSPASTTRQWGAAQQQHLGRRRILAGAVRHQCPARDSGHLFVAAAGNNGMDNDLMPH
jgi:hypothetical protein